MFPRLFQSFAYAMKIYNSAIVKSAVALAGVAALSSPGAAHNVPSEPPPPDLLEPAAPSCCDSVPGYSSVATQSWGMPVQDPPLASPTNFASVAGLPLLSATPAIWQDGVGGGFLPGVQCISISAGAGYGVEAFGGRQSHDLALTSLAYGYMLGSVKGQDHWYRGNWEVRVEFLSGAEFSPKDEWLVGLTPHLRYNFATGTHWVPYFDAGAGVTATSIGPPDLSHTFEFNLQAATGVRWFIRDNLALSLEARYLHMSCAGLSTPNLGLNNVNGMVGLSWFF